LSIYTPILCSPLSYPRSDLLGSVFCIIILSSSSPPPPYPSISLNLCLERASQTLIMLNTRSPRTKKDQPKEKASPSRLSSRSSPSRLNKLSGKTAPLLPAQIPLPPSPPASDALVLDDPFAPPSSPPPQQQQHQHQVQRRVSPRTKASASRQPVPQPTRRRSTHRALEAAIESKQLLSRARTKKRRVLEDQFQSSSPPTSPTNRKSSRTTKRLKTYSSPARRSHSSSPTCAAKDSPNNPFLAHPGEKPRRAGAKRDDEYRKLVYVLLASLFLSFALGINLVLPNRDLIAYPSFLPYHTAAGNGYRMTRRRI
jgi:hypothetical protein